ncbi:MAG: biotin/lipoyl-containing protein, partial [Vitreoscilla sp.]
MALVEVKVPDIGDFKDVQIIELLVKPGDTVKAEQSLVTVESDKASMEIPSSTAGVVKELKVALGDKINEGSLLLLLETGAAAAPAPAPAAAATPQVAPAAPTAAAPPPAPDKAAAQAAGSAAPAAAGGGSVEIEVPDIGDFADVGVIELLVKVGDVVQAEQSLITVESDKASMEIPSSHAGTIKALKVKVGDRVSKGSVIATIEATGAAAGAAPALAAAAPNPAPAEEAADSGTSAAAEIQAPRSVERPLPPGSLPAHDPTQAPLNLPHASPSIRRMARELGVPLDEVKGSGPHGRITQVDLEGFVTSVMAGATQTKAQAAKAPAAAATGGS